MLARDRTIRYAMVTDRQGHVLGHTEVSRAGQYRQYDISRAVLKKGPLPQIVYAGPRTVEAAASLAYPARCTLVAAMNPCS